MMPAQNTLRRLRSDIRKIENKVPITWKDIEFDDRHFVTFDFNGKFWEVDAEDILDRIGRNVTDFRICGGYNEPKYEQIQYELTIGEIDDQILKEWLMNHTDMWKEIEP